MAVNSVVSQLVYDFIQPEEVEDAFKLEVEGFPADEAATLDKLQYRQSQAPDLFLGAFTWRPPSQRKLVAFVCSTATKDASLSHDSMSTHDPTGQHAAIHSVVVSPKLKGQGVATALLQEYLKRLRANPRYTSAVLISHDNLIPLYQRAGFTLRGKSHVVHGSLPWFELAADVSAAAPAKPAQPAVVSPGRSYSEFQQNDLVDTQGKNRHALYCPRGACKCLLLNPGAAVLVERTYAPFLDPNAIPTPCPPDFPPSDATSESNASGASSSSEGVKTTTYWSAQPASALTFENVGFSKNVGGTIKLLTCADCDCGPLGWHDTQGADLAKDVEQTIATGNSIGGTTREFLLDVRRVRYAAK